VSRDRQEGENVEIRHIPASNILIAEDNPDDAFFLERAFAKSGIASRLFFVKDGQEVVDYLQGDKPFNDRAVWPFPDLLLLDLKMPRFSGLQVLKWLQGRPGPKKLPVVVLTGTDAPGDVKTAYALGADACLVKPGDANFVPFVQSLEKDWLQHLVPG
jgi:CheY-like chemotaxis protein